MIRSIAVVAATLAATAAAAADTRVSYFPVTPGAHPHDVAPAPDGSVYYTGQAKGYLGRLDPEDRQGREHPDRLGLGAAWRHRRAGRRGLDHRRRAERQSCASIRRPRSSTTSCCRRSCRRPISTPACSTRTASTGSPARTACMATSIPRPASTRAGSRRAAAATASR